MSYPLHLFLSTILTALLFYSCGESEPEHSELLPEDPSLSFKIGQMLKIGFRGLAVEDTSHIRRDIQEYHLGAVVLYDYDIPTRSPVRNIENPQQLSNLTSTLNELSPAPLLITIDQEGGQVARLKERHGFPPAPSAARIGEINSPDSTEVHARRTARILRRAGINVNLAPVVDVNLNPDNPIIGVIGRSFSEHPDTVIRHSRLFVRAHRHSGVLTTLKHFPGHGSSREDSHLGMVDVTGQWHPDELIPYRELIQSGDADLIMTAHIFNENWDEEWPATLSPAVITDLLREELGYKGVVISDDMQMDAIRAHFGLETAVEQALLAGVDILSFANNSEYNAEIVPQVHRIIRNLIESGRLTEERIDQSYRRIRALKQNRL